MKQFLIFSSVQQFSNIQLDATMQSAWKMTLWAAALKTEDAPKKETFLVAPTASKS
jgi:hypothetical protein